MHRLLDCLSRHRLVTLLSFVAAVAVLGAGALRLKVDNALEVWFVDDDPALVQYREFLEDFGNDEVVVTVVGGLEDPLAPESLRRLDALTRAHQAVDGIDRVLSLTSLPVLRGAGDGGRFGPASEGAAGAVDVEALRAAVEGGGLAGRLVGRDGESLVVYTWLAARSGVDAERPRILDALRAATAGALAGSGFSASHAGMGLMYDAINRATLGEGALFIGLSYVVIGLALLAVTRSWRWTLLAALAVGAADVALLGLMGWLERPLTMYSMTLPSLVLVLGVAGVLHLANHGGAEGGALRGAAPGALLGAVAVPALVNALTESVGFFSLATARTAITRDFGVFAGVGVLLAFACFLVVFSLGGRWAGPPRRSAALRRALERVSVACCRVALRSPRAVLLAAGLVAAISVLGVLRLRADTLAIDFLPDAHTFRADSARVEASVGPYLPLELVLTLPEGTDWKEPRFLRRLEAASRELEAKGLGRPLSVIDVLREVAAAASGRRAIDTALPESDEGLRALAARLGAVDEASGGVLLERLVARGGGRVRLTSAVPMSTALTFKARGLAAEASTKALLQDAAGVSLGGYLPLNWRMAEGVVDDQLSSFGLAFVVIFAVILVTLRDVRLAALALPPNILPVALTLGLMGFLGIRLDIATVTIAATVLGIVVDDTIHVLHQVHGELARGRPVAAALLRVGKRSSVGVLSTSLVLCAGFGVIALSSVHSVAEIGSLTAIAVGAAALADLLVLPAAASLVLGSRRPRGLQSRGAAASALSGPAARPLHGEAAHRLHRVHTPPPCNSPESRTAEGGAPLAGGQPS